MTISAAAGTTRPWRIGNAHLKWAFSEAICLLLRESPEAQTFVARKEKKHGKAKALSILAARLGRAVYWMLKKKEAFDMKTFFKNYTPNTGRSV